MVTASFYNDEKWDGGRSASKFTLNFGVRWGFSSQLDFDINIVHISH